METRDPNEVTAPTIAIQRPPPPDPLIGRMLGSWRVVRLLGRGGMGTVYLGEHPAIGSRVAIKVLHPRFADDPGVLDRFFNEARAANLIGHDNIVKVLDFNTAADSTYLVMEWLDGPTLETVLKKGRALPLSRAGPIALQICRALEAAHQHKILHRDLKPDNVFLVRQGDRADFVKVVDFGIAKLQDAGVTRTLAGTVLGTPSYMSPEQAQAQPVDARSDVYSLGVMLFQMATGRLPFAHVGPALASQLHAAVYEPPPRPRAVAPDVPEEYEAIILKALAKKREDRFQSMAQLHDAIFDCLERAGLGTDLPYASDVEPVEAGAQHGTPTPPRRTTRPPPVRPPKKPIALIAGVVAGVIAAAGIALGLQSAAQRREEAREQQRLVQEKEARERAARDERKRRESAEAERQRQAEEEARLAREVEEERVRIAADAERARRAAEEEAARRARETAPVEMVRLFLVSSPPAHFVAKWKGGAKQGETPMQLHVPRGSRVQIRYTRPGYAPFETRITAAAPQAVTGALTPQ